MAECANPRPRDSRPAPAADSESMAAWGTPKSKQLYESTPKERYDHASYLLALIARQDAEAEAAKRKTSSASDTDQPSPRASTSGRDGQP